MRRIPPVYSRVSLAAIAKAALASLTREQDAQQPHPLQALYPDRHVLFTDSGTTALALAMQSAVQATPSASGKTSEPVVALPAYGCPDLGTAALAAGCRIVLYDLNPNTLAPDEDSLRALLEAGVTMVVVTHLFGLVMDIPRIRDRAAQFGAVVIEDAAQHAGGTLRGVRGGSFGDYAVLSFGRGKGLNAGGGGALLLSNQAASFLPHVERPATRVESLAGLAKAFVGDALSQPWLFWLPAMLPQLAIGETLYHPPHDVVSITTSSRALLAAALAEEPRELAIRRSNEAWYRQALRLATKVALPRIHAESASGALRLPALMHEELGSALAPHGVARSYPRLLSDYEPIAARMIGTARQLPGAATLARSLFTLPTHSLVTERDRTAIAAALL